jgi:hypothetical protein
MSISSSLSRFATLAVAAAATNDKFLEGIFQTGTHVTRDIGAKRHRGRSKAVKIVLLEQPNHQIRDCVVLKSDDT